MGVVANSSVVRDGEDLSFYLPADLAHALDLRAGDDVVFVETDDGVVLDIDRKRDRESHLPGEVYPD